MAVKSDATAPGDVTVRAAVDQDLAAIGALRWSWLARATDPGKVVPCGEFVETFVQWARERTSHVWFVAVVGPARPSSVIGMACLATSDRVPSPRATARRTGDIQSVYVLPTMRNLGIGGRLIDALLVEASRQELERVVVHSSDGAVSAYDRAGFRSSARLRDLTL